MLSEVSEMSDREVIAIAPHRFSQVPQESVKLAAARRVPGSPKGGSTGTGGSLRLLAARGPMEHADILDPIVASRIGAANAARDMVAGRYTAACILRGTRPATAQSPAGEVRSMATVASAHEHLNRIEETIIETAEATAGVKAPIDPHVKLLGVEG